MENDRTLLMMSALRSPGCLASHARRITATLLAVVQLMMVLASLTELREGPSGWGQADIGERPYREGIAPSRDNDQRPRHDEATCPACIVRSLHARLEALAPLPVSGAEQPTAAFPAPASFPRINPSFSNHSRAPPVVA